MRSLARTLVIVIAVLSPCLALPAVSADEPAEAQPAANPAPAPAETPDAEPAEPVAVD